MKKLIGILAVLLFAAGMATEAAAYELPGDDSRAEYFYCFGPDGDPKLGAEDFEQEIFIDIPQNSSSPLYIDVYDPDTGDFRDLRTDHENPWDTVTEFSVYGRKDKLLAGERFGRARPKDRMWHNFGPFEAAEGEERGDYFRFRFLARGISGDDANLFKVRVLPYAAEAFSYMPTIRLLEKKGQKMFFYPEIPSGAQEVKVINYDVDPDGGSSIVYDPYYGVKYKIEDSKSGAWAETKISLSGGEARRLEYILTKKTQKYAHAGIMVKDAGGNALPIYFRKGTPIRAPKREYEPKRRRPAEPAAPKPAEKEPSGAECNKFTFDATGSYDPDNEDISFLWDFGDGATSPEPIVTHVYEKGGEYTVTLTVKDASGLKCDTSIAAQKIFVNTPAKPAFIIPKVSCVGKEITFDASASSDAEQKELSFRWDFQDGTTSEESYVRKSYNKGGLYTVTLTADDNAGTACSTASLQRTIKINTAPEANAGGDIERCFKPDEECVIAFDAGASSDADKDELACMWDFGDGTTAEGRRVTHNYLKGGAYTVKLVVDDGSGSACSTDVDTILVTLNRQPAAAAGEDIEYCVGTEASFDGSGSYDADGDKLAYTWDFGDGATAAGAKVKHSFDKGASYAVTLTVDDGKGTKCSGASDSLIVTANTRPVAQLNDVEKSCVGDKIRFDGSGSYDADGDKLAYTWDFGDGTIEASSSKVTHAYQKAGQYRLRLTVDDNRGSACSVDSATKFVRVNTPPVADAGPNLVCCVNTETFFDGSGSFDADGDKLTYAWDFGDGAAAEGAKVSHIYTERGSYNVTLTVDDGSGTRCSSSTDSFRAEVKGEPVAVIKIR